MLLISLKFPKNFNIIIAESYTKTWGMSAMSEKITAHMAPIFFVPFGEFEQVMLRQTITTKPKTVLQRKTSRMKLKCCLQIC